jgi:hypothetical protein
MKIIALPLLKYQEEIFFCKMQIIHISSFASLSLESSNKSVYLPPYDSLTSFIYQFDNDSLAHNTFYIFVS